MNISIENIASVSEENAAAVEEVSASTEEMSAQVEQVTASTSGLAEMAKVLQSAVTHFTTEAQKAVPTPSSLHSPKSNGHRPVPAKYNVN